MFGLRVLEPSRENQSDPSIVRWDHSNRCSTRSSPFGESSSPFIDEGDGFTRESMRERVCVCYLVLLPMPSGTRWFVGAHNIDDGWMHVVDSTAFFWYGNCQRLPYHRINVGAHNTVHVLTCLEGCGAPF